MERLTTDNLAEFSNEFQRGLFVISRYAGYLTLTLPQIKADTGKSKSEITVIFSE